MGTTLTDQTVRRLTPPATGCREIWDSVVPGFGCRVTQRGHRSFMLLTRMRGKVIRVGLGPWPATPLTLARDRAREALDNIAHGIHPREAKRPVEPAPVAPVADDDVEVIAARFIEKWAKPRNRTWKEQERLLTKHVLPSWRGRRLSELRRADVVALTDALVDDTPILANRVLEVVKRLFAWALNRGLIEAHPAAGLEPPAPEKPRDHVLSDVEIQALWKTWTTMSYPFGLAFQLLLLTATRRGEVSTMQWADVDLGNALWIVPAAKVKTKVPHVVPLSAPVVTLLASVPRLEACPYVFTTRRNRPIQDFSGAVDMATDKSGVTGWRTHDLRRTVRTELSRLGVLADTAERVLGHTIGGVRGVYDRYAYLPEKRAALDLWAAHLTAMVARDG